MLALRAAPPSFGIAEAERIARDHYGLAVSISPLPGERDCNFRLRTAESLEPAKPGGASQGVAAQVGAPREFVLKILELAGDAASIDCLVRVLDHLAEQDPTLPDRKSVV